MKRSSLNAFSSETLPTKNHDIKTNENGFTLVEVLAALLIFSFAIVALTHSGAESVRAVSVLEHKTYAGIVADNRIVQARLKPLKVGVSSGTESAAGRDYEWREDVSETESDGFYQIIVTVQEKNRDQILITRTAFRTRGNT